MATLGEIINSTGPEEKEPGILESFFKSFFARQDEMNRRRRDRRAAEALQGLEELKRQNELYPTAKRTEAIRQMEENLRQNGVLK